MFQIPDLMLRIYWKRVVERRRSILIILEWNSTYHAIWCSIRNGI